MLHAATIFLSACLLFLVQPLVAQQLLPWFGGAAVVWTTCLLFFQSALLVGYAYADALVRWLSPRQQVGLHAGLLLLSLAQLPLLADPTQKPDNSAAPTLHILLLLLQTVGLPYVLLASTTPLLQAWWFREHRSTHPYRLFALSNLASLLALLGYPLWLEPRYGVTRSGQLWSYGYLAFALCCLLGGIRGVRSLVPGGVASGRFAVPEEDAAAQPSTPPRLWQYTQWSIFAATATCLLLAITTHLTQNVAQVPLLWALPLAIYLLTFILSFDRARWYPRWLVLSLLALCLPAMAWKINSLQLQIVAPLYMLGLFLGCMFCHGELARRRPHPRYLTRFYLTVSSAGAFGTLLISVGAPLLFRGYYELHATLLLLALLLASLAWRQGLWFGGAATAVLALVAQLDARALRAYTSEVRAMDRNFYGVVRIRDWHKPAGRLRVMFHGNINHGGQHLEPARALEPVCYVAPSSGYGRLLRSLPGNRRVGVIGLGAGALMSYARPGDDWVFYELDPMVVDMARRHFTFAQHSGVAPRYVLGDGRLALEREAPRRYDLLAVDAFAGDSIPMHLITREAMALYTKHLAAKGSIVFQATNRFVDLLPVLRALADDFALHAVWVHDPQGPRNAERFAFATDQVILTRDPALLQAPLLRSVARPLPKRSDVPVFTDDAHPLLPILQP